MTITLQPGGTGLALLEQVWRGTDAVVLAADALPAIQKSADLVALASKGSIAIYGVNTGFGKLDSVKIPPQDTEQLQRNLVLSHCCGVGEPLETATTRLMMSLKLLSLGRGASGVRSEVCTQLEAMIAADVFPVIPVQGSVGASGDLAPLAHMAAVMIGEGEAQICGKRMSGADALEAARLTPITLQAKEGLALLNGTQFSTACALAALFDSWVMVRTCLVTSALSTDAIMGSTAPLRSEIHTLRGHKGQIDVADAMSTLLNGSEIRESHRESDTRVQDPYCIRCQPQVSGAAVDLIRFAARTLEIEANAVTDNPLVLSDTGDIVSGGNFHAEPVAFAADQIAMAISEIGSIAQRRVALMVDPTLSFDLPAFLSPNPGLNSGLMIAEVTTAALMSENKHLAHPCSIDSTPTSANQEDHVSMAAQGVQARGPLQTSPALQKAIDIFRTEIAPLAEDRYMADDINTAAQLVTRDALAQASGVDFAL